MVYVVRGHQYSAAYTDINASASIVEMESKTDSTSIVTNFDASITGDELEHAVVMHDACYIIIVQG